jgi:hypothetical protein
VGSIRLIDSGMSREEGPPVRHIQTLYSVSLVSRIPKTPNHHPQIDLNPLLSDIIDSAAIFEDPKWEKDCPALL